ncbi:MAG: hypothetical protein IT159_03285 [Bryobacterales bacterium]|nr:hypothetical protein [Bryobacterales bacterium]
MKKLAAVSIVGGESLIGREIREVLEEQKVPVRLTLVGVDEEAGTLTEQSGEPVVITPLDEETLRRSEVVILAGTPASSERALKLLRARPGGPATVDLTYSVCRAPEGRPRAPVVEAGGGAAASKGEHLIAHPAAVALALFLKRLAARFSMRRVSAHVFEPASERGQRGLDELREQTISLLSFKSMPKRVFDAQASFSMLARYGDDAPLALESVEQRIEQHLAGLLAGTPGVPAPSLRLVQAPVFHGYSISVHVEFEETPDVNALARALHCDEVDVRAGDLEPPNNVNIAGHGGIAVGAITPDRRHPGACWFWVVTDNYRLMAENAVAVIRSLLAPPAGAV